MNIIKITVLFTFISFSFNFFYGNSFPEVLAKEITIAVVRDGPSSEDKLVPQIETELQRLVKGGVEVKLKSGAEFDAN